MAGLTPNQAVSRADASARRHGPGPGGPSHFLTAEKPKDFKGSVRKIIGFLGSYKWLLLVVLVFALCSTAFSVIGPKILGGATTELYNGLVAKVAGTGGIDFQAIGIILLTTLAIYVASSLCTFGQGWIMASVTQKLCFDLRQAISAKINRIPFGHFDSTSTGDTLSRITNDVDTLGQTMSQALTQAVTSVVTLLGVTVMMFLINPILACVVLLLVPLTSGAVVLLVKISQKFFVTQQKTLGEINGIVEETFSGHAVVRAFNQEERVLEEFSQANNKLFDAAWKSQFASSFMKPTTDFLGNLGYVAVAILGSVFAAQGVMTVGDIQAFIQYEKNFMSPLQQLAQISSSFQQMAAAGERIFEFLDLPEESQDEASECEAAEREAAEPQAEDQQTKKCEAAEPQAAECEGSASSVASSKSAAADMTVVFDHVTFGYDPQKPVIRDFSATVKPGQTVALVGPTGAGKTTIIKLLMRFYDVQGGAITLGGRDLRSIPRSQVRQTFGMVLQDTWLFSDTVRNNIAYGCPQATLDDVKHAAEVAGAHRFISLLPGGYDFVINEDASNLSRGQLQLITIARAVLANHAMLILDEATSSVDTATEERIQAAMDKLMVGRTSFIVAHRLSTIKNADLILVIRDGDIVEQGNHETLLAAHGFYADLYNSQFEGCD